MKIRLKTAGTTEKLYCVGVDGMCGDITEGIVLEFENRGPWVVDYRSLEKILKLAKKERHGVLAR